MASKIDWADEDSDVPAGNTSVDWADEASEDERETAAAPPPSNPWGKKPAAPAPAAVNKDEEEFPTLGAQPTRRPQGGRGGRPQGGRGGGRGGYGGDRDRDERRDYPDRDQLPRSSGGGYGDRDREEGDRYGDRDRYGGGRERYGDRDRYGGDRERDRGYERPRYEDREEGDRYGDRRGGDRYGDRDRGYGDRDRGYGRRRDERDRDEPRPPAVIPEEGPWTAFVGNLNFKVEVEEIEDFFLGNGCKLAKEGAVRITRDRDDRPRGIAYVDFEDAESLRLALTLDGQDFAGRQIRLDVAENKRKEGDHKRREPGDRFGAERYDSAGDASNWRDLAKKAQEERAAEREKAEREKAEREKEREGRDRRDDRGDRREDRRDRDRRDDRRDDRDARPSARPPRTPEPAPALSEEEKKAREEKKNKAHNPFGDAKPRDELAAQRKLQELEEKMKKQQEEKQKEEEEKKPEEAPKKKPEEEPKKTAAATTAAEKPKAESTWRRDGQPGSAPAKKPGFDWKDKGTWNSEKSGAKRPEGGRGRGGDRKEGGRGEAPRRGDSGFRGGRGESPKRGEGRGERPAGRGEQKRDAPAAAKPAAAPAKAQTKAQPTKEEKPKESAAGNAFDLLGEAEA